MATLSARLSPWKTGLVAAEIALVEVVDGAQGAGEEAAPEGAVGNEPDAELAQRGQDFLLGVT